MRYHSINFNECLKRHRTKAKISQSELAKKIGVSTSSISSYENGSKAPPLTTAIAIAEYFNISLDQLCCDNTELSFNTYADVFDCLLSLKESLSECSISFVNSKVIMTIDNEKLAESIKNHHVITQQLANTASTAEIDVIRRLLSERLDINITKTQGEKANA
jgi:DNA-binding XRE family transcriptional regulator